MNIESTFSALTWKSGIAWCDLESDYPVNVSLWHEGEVSLSASATHYGFVESGILTIECASGRYEICPGMYFCIPGQATLLGTGRGVVSSLLQYNGFFQIGGPIETTGRLRYIDGCSDSLLISPVVLGDPCLNLLHIPAATHQTRHTHPTMRSGIIVSGSGICSTPTADFPLSPGTAFVIPAEAAHSFHTGASEALCVIAWHPDSDTGPSHDDHPMVNRTMVNGVPASKIPEIRT